MRQGAKWWKPVLGWAGVVLGTLGVLTTGAGIAGTWHLHYRIGTPLSRATDALGEVCVRVETGAEEIAARIQTSRDAVTEVDRSVTERTRQALNLSEQDVEKIGALLTQVRAGVSRVRDWAALAEAGMALIEQAIDIAGAAAGFFGVEPDSRADLADVLTKGREEIEVTAALLDEVERSLAELRAGRDTDANAGVVGSLAKRIDGSLAALQQYAANFGSGVGRLQDGIA